VADSLMFDASPSWKIETSDHPSRLLQFRIRSQDKSADDARLMVWRIPGPREGGNEFAVQKALDQWCAQIIGSDGGSTAELAAYADYRINGMPMRLIDISGRYVGETSPGSGVRFDKPGYRMIGAYINAPQGDYLVKMIGPSAVVAKHAGEFGRFLRSARPCDAMSADPDATGSGQGHAELSTYRN